MLDLFLLSCASGAEQANDDLGSDIRLGMSAVEDIVNREIAGETWRERAKNYLDNGGGIVDIMRIAETEAHRDTNEAAYVAALEAGATEKTWHCTMLPTSRDQHVLLNGVTSPIDGYFYTDTGAKAMYPGDFNDPENDCNCLCWITYSR